MLASTRRIRQRGSIRSVTTTTKASGIKMENESLSKKQTSNITAMSSQTTQEILLTSLAKASVLYDRPCSKELIDVWFETMGKDNPRDVRLAFKQYFRIGKKFPTPGDIREIIA